MADKEIMGELYRNSLKKIFAKGDLDLATIAQAGCLCCDIGEGYEIPALAAFSPKRFIATEPISEYSARSGIDNSLSRIAVEYPQVRIYREGVMEILTKLAEEEKRFGLITHLNVFPLKISREYVEKFFKLSANLLVPGGISVMSLTISPDRDSVNGVGLYTGGYPTLRGLGFHIFDQLPSSMVSSGGLFLGGIKPVSPIQNI